MSPLRFVPTTAVGTKATKHSKLDSNVILLKVATRYVHSSSEIIDVENWFDILKLI
jgi:putative aminopeptidase FrvX